MNIDRALRLRDRAKGQYSDIFSQGRIYGLTHTRMLEKRGEVLDYLVSKKAPIWIRYFLDGYWTALQESAYRNDLVYGAIIEGQFYSVHRERADYYERHGIEPSAYANDNPTKGHYWSGSLKPFFTSPD